MDSNHIYYTNVLGYCMAVSRIKNDNYSIVLFNGNNKSSCVRFYYVIKDELDHMFNWFINATENELQLSYENRNITQ